MALMQRRMETATMAEANWANRTIFEGDNLDVLRGMNAASVDLVYLDPPFNSNRTYSAPIGSVAITDLISGEKKKEAAFVVAD